MSVKIDKETILKFDVAGPRYTSYPTAPVWSNEVDESVYIERLKEFGASNKTLSLYIHIPFCQTMCTYCGCNVIIRKQDQKYGDEYLNHLFREIDLVAQYIGSKKTIRQFHWGGGTPTYLDEDQIEQLFRKVQRRFNVDLDGEVAIEIDPRTINKSKVEKLRALGFNRVSLGVQDFNAQVQKVANRIQSFKSVKELNGWCRNLGFRSVNFDLIYGLPHQTIETFSDTINKVIELKPDRIALYSFAYVPWLKKHQAKIDKAMLPTADEKLDIFLKARTSFLENGYDAIAMDHFALKEDELAKSFKEGCLYRNFMGYTVKPADEYIGLGLTSIGFLGNTYVHNHKVLKDYYRLLHEDKLPVEQGKILSEDDQIRQWTINSFMCQFEVDKEKFLNRFKISFDEYFSEDQEHIKTCNNDQLISFEGGKIKLSELGRLFVRNVCMGFDVYLRQNKKPMRFSRTV